MCHRRCSSPTETAGLIKKIVYTVTLFAVCVINGDNPKFMFSSVIPYEYTYAVSFTFLIVYTVTRFTVDVIDGKMMTKSAQRRNKKKMLRCNCLHSVLVQFTWFFW